MFDVCTLVCSLCGSSGIRSALIDKERCYQTQGPSYLRCSRKISNKKALFSYRVLKFDDLLRYVCLQDCRLIRFFVANSKNSQRVLLRGSLPATHLNPSHLIQYSIYDALHNLDFNQCLSHLNVIGVIRDSARKVLQKGSK